MNITIKTDVPLSRIADLLCDALEGGANYWYEITKTIVPTKLTFLSSPDLNDGNPFKHIDYPLNEGGAIFVKSLEEPEKPEIRVNLPAIRKGLQIMAEKFPSHWGDFIAENDDAITGDVFLQCVCFGDVIYG
jgi:hypothetical protein